MMCICMRYTHTFVGRTRAGYRISLEVGSFAWFVSWASLAKLLPVSWPASFWAVLPLVPPISLQVYGNYRNAPLHSAFHRVSGAGFRSFRLWPLPAEPSHCRPRHRLFDGEFPSLEWVSNQLMSQLVTHQLLPLYWWAHCLTSQSVAYSMYSCGRLLVKILPSRLHSIFQLFHLPTVCNKYSLAQGNHEHNI